MISSHSQLVSVSSRVVTVSSMAHKTGAIFFDDFSFKSISYRPFKVFWFWLNYLSQLLSTIYFLLTSVLKPNGSLSRNRLVRLLVTKTIWISNWLRDLRDCFFTKFTFQAYGQSKLANILFTKELARQVDGKHDSHLT